MIAISRLVLSALLVFITLCAGVTPCRGAAGVRQIETPALLALLAGDEPIELVNVLPKIIHDAQHIPGSVNIPLGQIGEAGSLPENRDTPLVFYCMGLL